MATRRRDILPGKEKATSSSQTRTPKLKGTVDRTATTTSSTAPKKPIKPAPKTTTTNISRQPVRKPVPTTTTTTTTNKPAQTKPRPSVNKTITASPKPIPKTRVASSPAPPRTAPLASRTTSSSQTRSLLTGSNARRSSIGLRKEAGTSTSTRQQQQQQQKQTASSSADRVDDLSMYYVPEPEIQLKDIEDSYLTEADDEIEQRLSSVEKGNIDVPSTEVDQPTRDEIAPVPEQKEALPDNTERQEDEPVVSKENDASEEVKRPAVERKREILFLPKQQEKMHGKFESPVSNSVIEEAVNKLLEQRRNRVRALAGAFETVISLQEK